MNQFIVHSYSSDSNESKKVVPKDMTEVMVPAAMETLKPVMLSFAVNKINKIIITYFLEKCT